MKRWYDVEITRVIVNGKGESTRRNTQHAIVWAVESEALGIGFRRCPDPFEGDDRRCVAFASVTELPDTSDLQGRKMETVNEEIEDGSAFGLSAEDLEAMASDGLAN